MDSFFVTISFVVVSCSLLAWLSCRTHQPVILAYFICGVILGPAGTGLVRHLDAMEDISNIGVVLLLFLAGMVLHPDRLFRFFKTAATVTVAGAAFGWILVFAFLRIWGLNFADSAFAAAALMFSSTILVVKLLPTTTLHQKRMGSICIAVLIAQDLLAVMTIMLAGHPASGGNALDLLLQLPVRTILLTAGAVLVEQNVIRKMLQSSERYREVVLMLCLSWCVGLAVLANLIGLPYAVGAFVAGVTVARGRLSLVMSEQLKPLRDFFLMFFFFTLGAAFKIDELRYSIIPAAVIAVLISGTRPLLYNFLLRRTGEEASFARETGYRLGQASEFALIIAYTAAQNGAITLNTARIVQVATVLTMLISSYIVVFKFPTPIGINTELLRD